MVYSWSKFLFHSHYCRPCFPSVIILPRLMHLRPPHTYLLAILFDFLLVVGFEVRFQVAEMLFDKSPCCTRFLLMSTTLLPLRNLFNSSTASSLPNRGIVNILICIVLLISIRCLPLRMAWPLRPLRPCHASPKTPLLKVFRERFTGEGRGGSQRCRS